MSDSTLTQMRLSMRLDGYLSDYSRKNAKKNPLYAERWNTAWNEADAARGKRILTPELVDIVRLTLEKLRS